MFSFCFFYITKDETPELMVMLNSFNFVQFAHARHSSSKLGSALAQSQISGSVRGERQEKARSEILKQVQDDIWRHLLFLHPFWESQFNTYVLLSKYFNVRQSTCLWPFSHQKRDFHKTPQLGVSN